MCSHSCAIHIQLAKIDGTLLRGLTRRGNDTSAYDLLGHIGVTKADQTSYNGVFEMSMPHCTTYLLFAQSQP